MPWQPSHCQRWPLPADRCGVTGPRCPPTPWSQAPSVLSSLCQPSASTAPAPPQSLLPSERPTQRPRGCCRPGKGRKVKGGSHQDSPPVGRDAQGWGWDRSRSVWAGQTAAPTCTHPSSTAAHLFLQRWLQETARADELC